MAVLSLQTVARATGGTVLSGDPDLTVKKYAIDSRHVDGGELFFALVGERNNGHDYLEDVFQRGAAAAVVSQPVAAPGPLVRVTDTTAALRTLARTVRLEWGGRVVGITGSCGKTTTKEMLRCILAASRPVLATRGNYNNLYGLPLMLLELALSVYFAWQKGGVAHGAVLIIVLLIWLSTFFVQVPLHQSLGSRIDLELIDRLASTNWWRTLLWTVKAVLVSWMFFKS